MKGGEGAVEGGGPDWLGRGQHLQQGSFLHEGLAKCPTRPPEVGDDLLPSRRRHIMDRVHFQHKLW